MTYITLRQSPAYHQISLEEFLFSNDVGGLVTYNKSNTRTREIASVTPEILYKTHISVNRLISKLEEFNALTENLRNVDRKTLYREFHIPKSSGGFRKIDAPQPELMSALRTLKVLFETEFHALYHTCAFAYIKDRSTLDAVKRHQSNESKWFGKYDLHNFFGSTTLDFIMKMLSMVYPFSEVIKEERGRKALETALELAILDGGLPQGTPISPLITNIMMIPIDYKLAQGFRDFDRQRYVYTRYADDFLISSRYDFDYRKVEKFIVDTLNSFGAPFKINETKTRYGSSAGRNFMLGVCLNSNNEITVGHKKKRQFQAALSSFVLDTMNGKPWDLNDVQVLEGQRSYYKMVEGDTIDAIVTHIGQKFNVDIPKMIKEQLSM